MFNLNKERSRSTTELNYNNLDRSKSISLSSLSSRRSTKYDHVPSKVKLYIQDIKKQQAYARHLRKSTSQLLNEPKCSSENFTSNSKSNKSDIDILRENVRYLSDENEKLELLFKKLVEERNQRNEALQYKQKLQSDYNELLNKYAQAENTIDSLRMYKYYFDENERRNAGTPSLKISKLNKALSTSNIADFRFAVSNSKSLGSLKNQVQNNESYTRNSSSMSQFSDSGIIHKRLTPMSSGNGSLSMDIECCDLNSQSNAMKSSFVTKIQDLFNKTKDCVILEVNGAFNETESKKAWKMICSMYLNIFDAYKKNESAILDADVKNKFVNLTKNVKAVILKYSEAYYKIIKQQVNIVLTDLIDLQQDAKYFNRNLGHRKSPFPYCPSQTNKSNSKDADSGYVQSDFSTRNSLIKSNESIPLNSNHFQHQVGDSFHRESLGSFQPQSLVLNYGIQNAKDLNWSNGAFKPIKKAADTEMGRNYNRYKNALSASLDEIGQSINVQRQKDNLFTNMVQQKENTPQSSAENSMESIVKSRSIRNLKGKEKESFSDSYSFVSDSSSHHEFVKTRPRSTDPNFLTKNKIDQMFHIHSLVDDCDYDASCSSEYDSNTDELAKLHRKSHEEEKLNKYEERYIKNPEFNLDERSRKNSADFSKIEKNLRNIDSPVFSGHEMSRKKFLKKIESRENHEKCRKSSNEPMKAMRKSIGKSLPDVSNVGLEDESFSPVSNSIMPCKLTYSSSKQENQWTKKLYYSTIEESSPANTSGNTNNNVFFETSRKVPSSSSVDSTKNEKQRTSLSSLYHSRKIKPGHENKEHNAAHSDMASNSPESTPSFKKKSAFSKKTPSEPPFFQKSCDSKFSEQSPNSGSTGSLGRSTQRFTSTPKYERLPRQSPSPSNEFLRKFSPVSNQSIHHSLYNNDVYMMKKPDGFDKLENSEILKENSGFFGPSSNLMNEVMNHAQSFEVTSQNVLRSMKKDIFL